MSDSSTSGMEVDLSDQSLKRLDRRDGIGVETLRLDNNQLQKLDNLNCFLDVWKLSAAHNQLTRMYHISKLHRLTHVDLSHNQILSIEGLKDLRHLQWLSLADNKLKSLQNIQFSVSLVHLDVSDNQIANLMDLSASSKLKTLLLNRNSIQSLEMAPLYLPATLAVLGLAENKISDLTIISFLTKLPSLEALSFFGNPCCVDKELFDYRPYIISWCLGLRALDDYVVTQRESLKAEWLYSQGKGRYFTIGQHQQLIEYLQQICPKQEPDDELEDRISRVLAMQRQHREQLLHEMSPLSTRRPRSAVGRLGGTEKTSGCRQWGDKMSQSLLEESSHSESFEKKNVCTELSTSKSSAGYSHRSRRDNIMTRSVPDLPPTHQSLNRVVPTPSNQVMSSSQTGTRAHASDNRSGSSRVSRSSSYSVPRKVTKTATVQPHRTTALYRKEKDKGEIERLKTRREFLHKSATRIQAAWRGYMTRKKQEKEIQHLRMRRVEEHLTHFVRRMEQLENTVRRQEQELAEERKARISNQEMLGRMLSSMDNIERHLQTVCVAGTSVEAPPVETTTDSKQQALAGEDVEMERSDTIESLSTRLSRLEFVIMNLIAPFGGNN